MSVLAACTKQTTESRVEQPVACGGYTEYRELNEEDAQLFAEVYAEEPALEPYAVATQVVAGTNYRFLCRDAEKKEYVVSVFVPLPCYADTQQVTVSVSKSED